jgi:hypothetical protein
VRKTGAGSAAQYLASGSNILLNNVSGQQGERSKKLTNRSVPSTRGSPRTKVQQTAVPVPKWSKIPVNLDLKEAEARFGIREFMMRFARIMEPSIAKARLMELDDISGKYPGDEEETAGWVSEACVRAITLGVLGLLAKQDDEGFAKVWVSSLVAVYQAYPVAVSLSQRRSRTSGQQGPI